MATKVMMEALSPTMEEGRLTKWLKGVGDAIKSGETIAEVETDKAIMELVARGEGVLRARLIEEGGTAPVGQTIGVIGTPDEDIAALTGGNTPAAAPTAAPRPPAAPPAAPPPAAAGSATPPATEATPGGNGTPQGTTAPSVPAVPDASTGDVAPPPVPPSEVPVPVPAEPAAAAAPPATAPAPAPSAASAPPSAPAASAAPPAAHGDIVRSSPLARRLASERGIALQGVTGSGPGGRIIRRDVDAAALKPAAAAAAPGALPPAPPAPAPTPQAAPAPVAAGAPPRMVVDGDFKDVPLTQMRKTIARRLSESIGPIPTFYLTAEIDMTAASDLRESMAAANEQFKVSVNDVVLKAVALALVQHPECNAHWMGDSIRYFSRVHLGMAVATEEGLIVPVITDAHAKGLGQIGREARELAKRARERKLAPAEYSGSTFSVSNLGMFGIDQFTAIINPPESGILAIGSVETRPAWRDNAWVPRRSMRITMSCDHRVIDGAVGARFLQTLTALLENPLRMLW